MLMEQIYRTRRERLRQAASELFPGYGLQTRLAAHLGRDSNYVSRVLNDPTSKSHKRIGEELARDIEQQLDKPAYWLDGFDSGGEACFDGYANANAHHVSYCGAVLKTSEQGCPPASRADITTMSVAQDALLHYGVKAEDAALLQACGNSMEPKITNGSLLLIDQVDLKIREGHVYAVQVAMEVLIRQVQWLPGGLRLIADNPAYEAIDAADATVIGRVVAVWRASRIPG